MKLKDKILNTTSAVCIGIVFHYLYFSFYGIIAGFAAEKRLIAWIHIFPKPLRIHFYWFHFLIIDCISAIFVSILLGMILGRLLNKSPRLYALLAFTVTYTIYLLTFYEFTAGIDYFLRNEPIWYFIARMILFAFILVAATKISFTIKTKKDCEFKDTALTKRSS